LRTPALICPLLGLPVTFASFVFMARFMLTDWMGGSERAQFSVVVGLFALAVLNA